MRLTAYLGPHSNKILDFGMLLRVLIPVKRVSEQKHFTELCSVGLKLATPPFQHKAGLCFKGELL